MTQTTRTAWQRRLSITGIGLGMVALGMLFSMINMALPTIQQALHASVVQLQWVMNVFGIFICASLVMFGRMADIFGRKKIFLLGMVLVAIAMLSDTFSRSIGLIIGMQVLTGLGNAIMLAASQAMMSNEFPVEQRGRAIGLWAAIIGISLAIGPLLGGVLIGLFNWRAVFGFIFIASIIAIVLISLFSQESKNLDDPPHLDWLGMLLLMVMIASVVLAIAQLGAWAWYWSALFAAVFIIAALILFYVEKRMVMPIVRADLLRNRCFMLAALSAALIIFFTWSEFFLLPLFLQTVAGFRIVQIGLVMLFVALPLIFLSPVIGRLYCVATAWRWVVAGFICLLVTIVIQLHFGQRLNLFFVILATLTYGLAWALVWGPATTLATSALSLQQAGIASGTYVTFQEIGGVMGVTVTVLIARSQVHFINGFHYAMWVLFGLACLGVIGGLCLRKRPSGHE